MGKFKRDDLVKMEIKNNERTIVELGIVTDPDVSLQVFNDLRRKMFSSTPPCDTFRKAIVRAWDQTFVRIKLLDDNVDDVFTESAWDLAAEKYLN